MTQDALGPEQWTADRAIDRLQIEDALRAYGYGIDVMGNKGPLPEGNADDVAVATNIFSSCMHPDVAVTIFLAGRAGPSAPMGEGGPASFARAVRAYFDAYGYVGTMHNISNVRVIFAAPDRAHVTSYIPALHWLADGRMLLTPVSYDDVVVRTDDRWTILTRAIIAGRFWITDGYAPNPLDPQMPRA